MKVICVENNIFNLCKDKVERLKRHIRYTDGLIHSLSVNRKYLVYGLVFRNNCLWYQICHDLHDTYPHPYPSELFDVLDPNFSKHWAINGKNNGKSEFFISSEKIVNEAGYLERLIDGDAAAEEKFYQYRLLIEAETALSE